MVLLVAPCSAAVAQKRPAQPAPAADNLRVDRHDAAPAGDVEASATVDRTALWPGDRVWYTLDIRCVPGVDLLPDDLSPDRLVLTGLERLSSSQERTTREDGGTSYRVRHQLTAYEIGAPLRVEEQSFRYLARRPGQRVEDGAPAGEVRVPALTLALRGAVPDDLAEARLRDDAAPAPLPPFLKWGRLAGLALVLACALPLLALGGSALRRSWRARGAGRPRAAGRDLRPALTQLQAVDADSPAARRAAYDRLDALLRQRLAEISGIDARALTAAEIAQRVESRRDGLPPGLGDVLDECESARYAPPDALPSPDRFAAGVATAAALLGVRRWS